MRVSNIRASVIFFVLLVLPLFFLNGDAHAQERQSPSVPSLDEINTPLGTSVLEELVEEKLSTDTAYVMARPAPSGECPVGNKLCLGKGKGASGCCEKTMKCDLMPNGDAGCTNPCGANALPCSVRNGPLCCQNGTHCVVTPDPTGKNDKAVCMGNPPPPPPQVCLDPKFPVPCGTRCCDPNQQCIGENMCAPAGDYCTFFNGIPTCCKPPSTPYPDQKCCPSGTIYYPKYKDCWEIDAQLCDDSVTPPLFCKGGAVCDIHTRRCQRPQPI